MAELDASTIRESLALGQGCASSAALASACLMSSNALSASVVQVILSFDCTTGQEQMKRCHDVCGVLDEALIEVNKFEKTSK